MKKRLVLFFGLFTLFVFSSQASLDATLPKVLVDIVDSVRQKYVPDKRVAIFDVDVCSKGDAWVVKGVTTIPKAKQELLKRLRSKQFLLLDSLVLLPEKGLGEKSYGVVNLSVVNIRKKVSYASEMMTQALLGMPVRILQYDEWYRVQTPDDYISWVNPAGICAMTKSEYDDWNAADKVVVTIHSGFTYELPDEHSQSVSDVVSGNMLRYEGIEGNFYKVSYPDGRKAFLPRSYAMRQSEWLATRTYTADSLIKSAKSLMGVPYLWGGMSSKGVDCSGLVRTSMFLNGIIIPRDASQQALVGEKVDLSNGFDELKPGDLLFFGQKATATQSERVIHVGIYIGNLQFIHSQGMVHISSFNPKDKNYDRYNLNRLLRSVRILGHLNTPHITTLQSNTYYQP